MPRLSTSYALEKLRNLLEVQAPLAGDRLPPERALAAEIGCSRATLRAALAVLEGEREIWRHVGQGTFRGAHPGHRPLRDSLLIQVSSPTDLMDARLLIEPQIAAAAARRAEAADIALLRIRVRAGRTARDRAACEQADSAFHRAVAGVARNPVLIGVLTYLSDARRHAAWQREWDRTYRRIGVEEFAGLHSDQHDRIVDAISAGDASRAAAQMRGHLETISQAMSDMPPLA